MRHRKAGRKLGRSSSHRLAMFRNLVTSVLDHERVMTTDAKAKEIRRWVDWMITLGKRGDLAARRQALKVIRDKSVVHKVFAELAPRYQNVNGGYTRVVKIGYRRGDGAPMSMIELIEVEGAKPKPKKKKLSREKAKETAPREEAVKIEEKKEEAEAVAAADQSEISVKEEETRGAEEESKVEELGEEAKDATGESSEAPGEESSEALEEESEKE